jgi:hypothetical protein
MSPPMAPAQAGESAQDFIGFSYSRRNARFALIALF